MTDTTKYFYKEVGSSDYRTGTKEELVEELLKAKEWGIAWEGITGEDGGTWWVVQVTDEDGDVIYDEHAEEECDETALDSVYDQVIEGLDADEEILCTLCEAWNFTVDYEDVLDDITAREVRENGLDLDDEMAVREWYYSEKVA